MKTINKFFLGVGLLGGLASCSDFDDVNTNPLTTPIESTRPEYFLNNAIGKIQMEPGTAERIYVYNWGDAARAFGEYGFLSTGSYSDDFVTNYYYPCIASTITNITLAISEAEKRADKEAFYNNVQQIGRIWRALVIAQFTDSFGPYPLNAAEGNNPEFSSEKETYQFILTELREAVNNIDTSVMASEEQAKCDPAYGYDAAKWLKLGNSLRMRYAMRLSNTEIAADAQKEFEDACKDGNYIQDKEDMLWFKSDDAWSDYTNPFARPQNFLTLSSTIANMVNNLGGVSVSEQRADLTQYVKKNTYLGLKFDKHFVANTDDPTKQYWLDGIPEKLDPRALKLFWIVGDENAKNAIPESQKNKKVNPKGSQLLVEGGSPIEIKGAYTWNGVPVGSSSSWSPILSNNQLITTSEGLRSCYPQLGVDYCTGSEEEGLGRVVFFGAWESHFLMAEAALYGWATNGVTDEQAYEKGVRASFDYFGVSEFADDYLQSEDYNRVGTSVKYAHTAEPASFQATYVDGYNQSAGVKTVTYNYPDASKILYPGKKLNDKLTKIITQKYLAQMPYLVQEAWSDHRRLGLPFFDMVANTAIVMTGSDLTDWHNDSWQSGQSWKYYPQRMRYPQSLLTSDEAAYNHALELLGGKDNIVTPLWWSLGATQK